MAINPISELSNMYAGISKTGKNDGGSSNKVDAAEFQTYMQDATTKNGTKDPYMDDLPVASDRIMNKDAKLSEVDKSAATVEEKVNNNSDSLSTTHKDVKTVEQGATKELKDKIIDEAAKELGTSEEDIVEILSQLGIGAADLLNTENVSLLVANVEGDGDVIGILTDENAAEMVLELNANIESILSAEAEASNVTPELMKELTIASDQVFAEELVPEGTIKEVPVTEEQNIVVSHEVVSENIAWQVETTEDNMSKSEEDDTNTRSDRHDNTESIAQHVMNVTVESSIEDAISVSETDRQMLLAESSQLDTIDIINQIQEHVRVELKEDMTQLQMQLNPENLGTVNLTIAAKEGNVTAQLTTQNEAVQAALESQISMLRESLEQQGVKVEAIEVTVASHEFEQNLEQGNDFNNQQEEENERLRKATRRIDINGIMTDEDIEGLDEAEQVTAKMMQADGNSMDYRV